jgi:AcrR family transcriptional regulator
MKYDIYDINNKFAIRTLNDFSKTLMKLIAKKPFEKITVNELCKLCNYPRATFYNYFEDIYSLLDYCWYSATQEINIQDYLSIAPEVRAYVLFERFYDYLNKKRTDVERILRFNETDGMLLASMHRYMQKMMLEIIKDCPCSKQQEIPYEVVGRHFANTILLVLQWGFVEKKKIDKEVSISTLKYLLKDL